MNKFGKVGYIPHLSVGFTREFANFFHKISVGVTNGDYASCFNCNSQGIFFTVDFFSIFAVILHNFYLLQIIISDFYFYFYKKVMFSLIKR